MRRYINCHVHSEASLLDGAAKITSLAETAKKNGHEYLCLTDHGSMSGVIRHKRACEANGVKPIFGVELYLAEEFDKIKEDKKLQNLHLTALAKSQKGFELLINGLNYANNYGLGKSGRAKRAFLPVTWPIDNGWAGNVVILSGCSSSPFWNVKNRDGIKLFQDYSDAFKEDFYGEMMPLDDWDIQYDLNKVVHQACVNAGRKYVLTNDIHYCGQEDWKIHELVICLGQHGMTWNNPHRWKFSTHRNYFRDGDDMYDSMLKMGMDSEVADNSIFNTNEVAEKCYFDLQKYPLDLPCPVKVEDENEYFLQQCAEGLKRRGLEGRDEYWIRLDKESKLIIKKGFVRYMLLVADVINWAKGQGIMVGPARGSAGGCLVSYLLGITEIDPIKHDLLFERFISEDRRDHPDIDVDIAAHERNLIERYLKQKYGDGNVAHVSTFSACYGRSALRDVSRIFEIPLQEVDVAAKSLIYRHESDARVLNVIEDTLESSKEFQGFAKKYPDVVMAASKLEGQIRGVGVHAAGYVVSNNSLLESNRCYLVSGTDGEKSINWDKDDLEDLGYIKIDILGLSTLSVIQEALILIRRNGTNLDLSKLELFDEKTYEAMGRGETATVFQINTPSLTSYCKELKPQSFEDVAALTALWRPGPIQAGQANDYILVRHGKKEPVYLSNGYKEIVQKTRGQLIYQEQISQLLVNLAGFTPAEADKIRKIIAKSKGIEKIREYSQRFIDGCVVNKSLSGEQAGILWEKLLGFGLYSFNRSHAVAYGLLTYWTMYLKIHYPTEYICAYLSHGSTDRESSEGITNLDSALREARRIGIEILGPDILESMSGWTVAGPKALRAGLQEVKYAGEKAKDEIFKLKSNGASFRTIDGFMGLVGRRTVNKRVIKSLLHSGAFDSLSDSDLYKRNFDEIYETYGTKEKHETAKIKAREMELEPIVENYLNYDGSIVTEIEDTCKDICKVLGENYEVVDGDIVSVVNRNTLNAYSHQDLTRVALIESNLRVIRNISPKREFLDSIRDAIKTCTDCDLRQGCKAPVPFEKGKQNVLIVAEAPGYNEDQKGKPLIGKSGQVLFSKLRDLGISRNSVYIDNVVHCKPQGNFLKSTDYIDGCRHLTTLFDIIRPILVLVLGNKSLYYFKGKDSGIMSLSGTTEWDKERKCWLTYCVHPSSVLHSNRDEMVGLFDKGLKEFKRVYSILGGEYEQDQSGLVRSGSERSDHF